jgi:hypothetical protein
MKTTASFLLLLAFALLSLVAAIPAPAKKCVCSPKVAEQIALKTTLAEFQKKRKDKSLKCCNWSTDRCSKPFKNLKPLFNFISDITLPFDKTFEQACVRHDFGFRNKLGTLTSAALSEKVDLKFRDDMRAICKKDMKCKVAAEAYFRVVRGWNKAGEAIKSSTKSETISLR